MTLEEFRRTRVPMTVDQYKQIYGEELVFPDDTAKIHCYKDGLYIRELLDGEYASDLHTDNIRSKNLEWFEETFWHDFAKATYNTKPNLPVEAYTLLKKFRTAMSELLTYWVNESDEIQELLNEDYPEDAEEFGELFASFSEWINETTKAE